MKVLEVPDYFGYTLFCDDVRQELGGKASFIGCYRGIMFVHDPFPAVIPKFVVAINFFQRKEVIRDSVRVRIYLPGDVEDHDKPAQIEGVIGSARESAERIAADLSKFPGVDTSYMRIESPLVFTPLILSQPGIIKVRILLDNDLAVRIGQLQVVAGGNAASTTPLPSAS